MLHAIVCCFKRFFEQNDIYGLNPLNQNDPVFGNFRAKLDAEMKHFHGKGLGTIVRKAEPISPDEETLLLS